MEDETLVRLLAENVAYQAAFKTSMLVLKEVVPLVAASAKSRAAADRSRDVMSLMRGEFLSMLPGFRDDLEDDSNRHLRAKLAELLDQIEPLLVGLDPH